jgi:hypothetical protein
MELAVVPLAKRESEPSYVVLPTGMVEFDLFGCPTNYANGPCLNARFHDLPPGGV